VPNHEGGRENLEAISLLKHVNEQVSSAGAITVAEEAPPSPASAAPPTAGGLGFHFKWNMGWMNDTLRYMHRTRCTAAGHHTR
jgi:1,4-alpha-glucan branching enzyme